VWDFTAADGLAQSQWAATGAALLEASSAGLRYAQRSPKDRLTLHQTIPAQTYNLARLRLAASKPGSAVLEWSTRQGQHHQYAFLLWPDKKVHTYELFLGETPGWQGQLAALALAVLAPNTVELRVERTELCLVDPSEWYAQRRTVVRYDFDNGLEGWQAQGQHFASVEVQAGRLDCRLTGPDARLVNCFPFEAASAQVLRIGVRTHSYLEVPLAVYLRTSQMSQPLLAASFPSWGNAGWRTEQLVLPTVKGWSGRADYLRLDPSPVAGRCEIEFIELADIPISERIFGTSKSHGLVRLGGESRPAWSVLGREWSATVRVPARAVLECGVGLVPEAGNAGLGAVRFRLFAHGKKRLGEQLVIDPAAQGAGGWQDMRLDLTPVAGQRCLVGLTVTGNESALQHAVVTSPTVWRLRGEKNREPNFLWITIDALRADRLGCYGYAQARTPAIDAFARQALKFERAIAQATWTLPSAYAMHTGLYPLRRGDTTPMALRVSTQTPTVAASLAASGYDCAAFTEGGFVGATFGFAQGFSRFREDQTSAPGTVERATQWLRQNERKKFFLFVRTYQVHDYYTLTKHCLSEEWRSYRGRVTSPEQIVRELFDFPSRVRNPPSPTDIQYLSALYDGEVAYTDQAISRLLREIEGLGLGRNTVVIITSDHGEEFYEHGGLHHGAHPVWEVIRVPLLIRVPTVASRTVAHVVETCDLAPTLLALAGATIPKGLDGESLTIFFKQAGHRRKRQAFTENQSQEFSLVDAKRQYLAASRRRRLYDLETDPAAVKDLAPTRPAECEQYQSRLEGRLHQLLPGFRIALAPHTQPLRLEIEAEHIGFFSLPGARRQDAFSTDEQRQHLTVHVDASAQPTTIFFGLNPPTARFTLRVWAGEQAIPPEQLSLGAKGIHPAAMPLEVPSQVPLEVLEGVPPSAAGADQPAIAVWYPSRAALSAQGGPRPSLDKETLERLRALGYLGG